MKGNKTKKNKKEIKNREHEIVSEALFSISNITRVEIIKYIREHKKVTFEELRTVFNLNNNTLCFHLRKLQDAYIISQPKQRGPYELGELGKLMLNIREELEIKAIPILVQEIINNE